MSMPTPADSDADQLGPIDFLAIEFPNGRVSAHGFDQLLSLVNQEIIRILDVEFIVKDADGTARTVDIGEIAHGGDIELSAWVGASSGILDRDDVHEVATAIQPGSVAAIVVYENQWVLGLVNAWQHEGARLIGDGGVAVSDLVAALEATEPT
jgi:hypothetical protein